MKRDPIKKLLLCFVICIIFTTSILPVRIYADEETAYENGGNVSEIEDVYTEEGSQEDTPAGEEELNEDIEEVDPQDETVTEENSQEDLPPADTQEETDIPSQSEESSENEAKGDISHEESDPDFSGLSGEISALDDGDSILATSSVEDFYYRVNSEGEVEIDEYIGSESNVVIPSLIEDKSVVSINYGAFQWSEVSSVVLPETITRIDGYAFAYCSNLTEFVFPSGIQIIGENAFEGCSGLSSISIPEGIKVLEGGVFSSCSSLTSVSLPSGLERIGSGSFSECTSLSAIDIPPTVTSIDSGAFSGCSSLTSISIPNGIETVEYYTFANCNALNHISLPDSVTRIGYEAFKNCASLEHIVIPDSVSVIGREAFKGCSSLISIAVPNHVVEILSNTFTDCSALNSVSLSDSLTSIGEYAFQNCKKLTQLIIPESVAIIGQNAFEGCTGLTSINIPESLSTITKSTFEKCISLQSVIIPANVKSIGDRSFYGCSDLETVTLNEGLESIGKEAFYNCYSLSSINFPSTLTQIGESAFYGCRSISDADGFVIIDGVLQSYNGSKSVITIPDSVHTIGDSAFFLNSTVSSVYIPESVKSLKSSAFMACSNLSNVIFLGNSSLSSIDTDAFCQCPKLSNITIPESVKTIGLGAFYQCSALSSFTFPSGLISIGREAFEESGLTSVSLPESVESVEDSAFKNCTRLRSLSISNQDIHFGYSPFEGCTQLAHNSNGLLIVNGILIDYNGTASSVSVPSTVSRIADYAFRGKSSLTSVSIPSTVVRIGDAAFGGCTGLSLIQLPANLSVLGESAFYNCTSLVSITIPSKITSISDSLFKNCSNLESVTVKGNVTGIGNSAFEGCKKLSDLTIPSTVVEIGERAFFNCQVLPNIQLPSGLKEIAEYAFWDCYGLTEIVIPDQVETIHKYAFDYCKNLTTITIPKSVKTIDSSAFNGCNALKTVNYTGNQIDWGKISISSYGNTQLTKANINYSSDYIDSLIFKTGERRSGSGYIWDGSGNLTLTDFEGCFLENPAIQIPDGTTIHLEGDNIILSSYGDADNIGNIIKAEGRFTISSYSESNGKLTLIDDGNNNAINSAGNIYFDAPIDIRCNAVGILFDSEYGRSLTSVGGAVVNIKAKTGISATTNCNVTFTSKDAKLNIDATSIGIDCNILDLGNGVYNIRTSKKTSSDEGVGLRANCIIEQGSKRTGSLFISGSKKAVEFVDSHDPRIYLSGTSYAIVEPSSFEVNPDELIDLSTSQPAKTVSIQPYVLRVIDGKGTTKDGNIGDVICVEADKKDGLKFDKWIGDKGNGLADTADISGLFANETNIYDEKAYICLDGNKHFVRATYIVPVGEIKLNKEEIILLIGKSETLSATLLPENASNKSVDWSSDDPEIATVDENGTVYAISKGSTYINAVSNDGEVSARCKVTVNVPVAGISLDQSEVSIFKGQSTILQATITPEDAADKTVKWESSDTSIATVDETGKVTGVDAGNTFITVTTTDGEFTATCEVIVSIATYTITFLNEDGTVLQSSELEYGSTPVYAGPTPSKQSTIEYDFTFNGWTPEITTVTGDASYTALYKQTARKYTVTFDTDGGSSVSAQKIEYNSKASKPADPSKTGYTFDVWTLNGEEYDFNTSVTEDITLKAKWNEKDYSVIYNGNGYSSGSQKTDTRRYSEAFILPLTTGFTKKGYTFDGWYDAKQGGNKLTEIPAYTAKNMTVYAHWKVNTYTITFLNEDGTVLQSSELEYGSTPVYAGPTPSKQSTIEYDFTFNGWTPEITTVTGDASYTALYKQTARKYTVTFDTDGGSSVSAQKIEYNSKASKPADPSKTGYTFDVWTLNGEEYDFNTSVTEDITLKAKWNEKDYSVIYNGNGYSSGSQKTDTRRYSEAFILPLTTGFTKKGYTFDGWYDAKQGGNKLTEIPAYTAKNMTVYAHWKVNTYTITFLNEDGTVLQSSELEYGSTPVYAGPTPSKQSTIEYDFTFNGWTPEITTVTGDASYTALYKQTARKYTVTFDTDGGSSVSAQKIEYNSKASKPADPSKTGYTFDVWTLNGEEYDFNTSVTEDITLKAKWKKITAYAVLNKNNELIMFNSWGVYENDSMQEVEDIDGKEYSGIVFSDIDHLNISEPSDVPWYQYRNSIFKVFVAGKQVISPESVKYWFYMCENLTYFDSNNLKLANCSAMHSLFDGCKNLRSVVLTDEWKYWKDSAYLPDKYWTNGTVYKQNDSLYSDFRIDASRLAGEWTKVLSVFEIDEEYSVNLDKKIQIEVNGDFDENYHVEWASSDEKIAEVDSNGNVTGKTKGDCTVYAALYDSKGTLIVSAPAKIRVLAWVEEITIKNNPVESLLVSNSLLLQYSLVTHGEIDTGDVSITSSDTSVATVSSSGLIYARKEGVSKITVKVGDLEKSIVVIVSKTQSETSKTYLELLIDYVMLYGSYDSETGRYQYKYNNSNYTKTIFYANKGELIMYTADETASTQTATQLLVGYSSKRTIKHHYQGYPKAQYEAAFDVANDSAFKNFTFILTSGRESTTSKNSQVMVTLAIGYWDTLVKNLIGIDRKQLYDQVPVVTGIYSPVSSISLKPGATYQLNCRAQGSGNFDSVLYYASNDESVATVDASGLVTAVGNGQTKIIVASRTGNKKIYIDVNISNEKVKSISLEKKSFEMYPGDVDTIKIIYNPTSAANKDVIFSCVNEDIVKVDENGTIVAISGGTTTVNVRAKDGSYSASAIVKVNPVPNTNDSVRRLIAYIIKNGASATDSNSQVYWVYADESEVSNDTSNRMQVKYYMQERKIVFNFAYLTAYSKGQGHMLETTYYMDNYNTEKMLMVTIDDNNNRYAAAGYYDMAKDEQVDADRWSVQISPNLSNQALTRVYQQNCENFSFLAINKWDMFMIMKLNGHLKDLAQSLYINPINSVIAKKTIQLSVKGAKGKIAWSSSDKNKATISSEGLLKGIKPGKVLVTAKDTSTGYFDTIEVRVLFSDVTDPSQFYYEYVYSMSDRGIVNGWDDGTFRPNELCNRAAIITFLWKMAGRPMPEKQATFRDMTDDADFNNAISWGVENGIVTGWTEDNTFRPWDKCNRAAIITFLWRYAGRPMPEKQATFKDMTGNADFDNAISWGVENGITTGWDDNTFRPWDKCKRLAAVSFLGRSEALDE